MKKALHGLLDLVGIFIISIAGTGVIQWLLKQDYRYDLGENVLILVAVIVVAVSSVLWVYIRPTE